MYLAFSKKETPYDKSGKEYPKVRCHHGYHHVMCFDGSGVQRNAAYSAIRAFHIPYWRRGIAGI